MEIRQYCHDDTLN